MPEQSLSTTYIFSLRHITAFFYLGTLDSTSALHLGDFKQKKKAQKCEKHSTKETRKRTLAYNFKLTVKAQ